MKLYLVRHGESIGNVNDIVQGQLNLDLTLKGYEQAEKIGERLKHHKFDKIYTSDLRRAEKTASAIIQHHNNELEINKILREITHGKYEGSLYSKVPEELLFNYRNNPDHKYDGGESFNEVIARIKPFYEQLLKYHKGKEILIVAHGHTIRSFLTLINQMDRQEEKDFREFCKNWDTRNTGIYEIDLTNPKEPQFLKKNCLKHLE